MSLFNQSTHIYQTILLDSHHKNSFGKFLPGQGIESSWEETPSSPMTKCRAPFRVLHPCCSGHSEREEKLSSTLLGYAVKGLQIKLTKATLTEKTHRLINIFFHGNSQKEVQLKETVRLGGFYHILTKEKGFRLQGMDDKL